MLSSRRAQPAVGFESIHSAGEHDPERARPRKFWRLIDGPLKRPIDQTLRFRHGSAVTDSKKICGPSARKFFSRFFFFLVRPILVRPFRWRKSRPLAKISAVRENLGRLRKSRPFAKISDVGENLGRWRKSRTLAKISAVRT